MYLRHTGKPCQYILMMQRSIAEEETQDVSTASTWNADQYPEWAEGTKEATSLEASSCGAQGIHS